MSHPQPSNDYNRYVEILLPLFQLKGVNLFDQACSLLRVRGTENEGWDTLTESRNMLEDLVRLNQLPIDDALFENSEKTHWRLHLLSYVHLTEMSAPYHIFANLFRIRGGLSYTATPFRIPDNFSRKPKTKGPKGVFTPPRQGNPSPQTKISEIQMLAAKAGISSIAKTFNEFYFPPLRNAIAHSDYILGKNEIRLIDYRIEDEKNPHLLTSVITYERLGEIIIKAYDFYTAFFMLESLSRSEFVELDQPIIPYDHHLKGLLEFLIDPNKLLSGFKIHWPNRTESVYERTSQGCKTHHISVKPDGGLTLYAGDIASDPHLFSPLLSKKQKPRYTPKKGNTRPLHWTFN